VEFLKRHYEKLILLGLALTFIATMFHVLSIINRTREVKDSHLRIPHFTADYQQRDPADPAFRINEFATATAPRWAVSTKRSADCSDYSSDLVQTFEMARCPYCGSIIPYRFCFLKTHRCIFECQNSKARADGQPPLPTPPERPVSRVGIRTAEDGDGDGIKDADEKKYGLNAENPDDALQDNDGDGFSNLFEVEQGYNPVNALSHPPLWMRLRFAGMDRVPLPLKFSALNTQNSKDKKKWDIQLNLTSRNYQGKMVEKTRIEMLGSTVPIEKREYKIVDIELRQRRLKAKKNAHVAADDAPKEEQMVDESLLFLEEVVYPGEDGRTPTPDKLVVKVGETAFSSDRRLILEDVGVLPDENGKRPTFVLRSGDEFSIGDRRTGIAKLVLKSVDEEAKTAVLMNRSSRGGADPEFDLRKKRMVVTEKSAIPEEMWVTHPLETPAGGDAPPARGR